MLGIGIGLRLPLTPSVAGGAAPTGDFLLWQTGDNLLWQTGDSLIWQ